MGKRRRSRRGNFAAFSTLAMLSAASWVTLAPASASNAPPSLNVTGETVMRGNVTFHRQGGHLYIHASDGSVINFNQFNIGHGAMVQFLQPHEMARVLNRVTGGTPTVIEGSLLANGHVYLVNPAGIVFGQGSVVNVGGIHAAAGSMTNSNFLSRRDNFDNLQGSVINHGSITGREVHLVGRNVANHGSVNAGTGGIITMLAGKDVHIRRVGDRIAVRIDGALMTDRAQPMHGSTTANMQADPAVENTGSLNASGGHFALGAGDMYALAVRNTGDMTNTAGRVDMVAKDGLIQNDGLVSVGNSGGAGGRITIQAPSVLNRGEVNADGDRGRIEMTSQHHTYMTPGSLVTARGGEGIAEGGNILIHSYDGTTILATGATVDIRGGDAGGDGGFVEISGATVIVNGDVHVGAESGWQGGTLLIDPLDIIINDIGGDDAFLGDGFFQFEDNGLNDSFIAANTLQNIFGLIRLQALGSIKVETEVNLTLNNDIWFEAYRDIIFEAAINGARTMILHADWNNDGIGFVDISVPLTVSEWIDFRGNQIRLSGAMGGPGSITTGTYQLYKGNVLLGGDMTLNASEVIFNGSVRSLPMADRALTINAANTTFGGSVGFDPDEISDIFQLRELTVNGNALLNGNVVRTRLGQMWNGTLFLGADNLLMSTGGGDIRFVGAVDGAHDLTVNTGGMIRFDDRVGGLERLRLFSLSGAGMSHLFADVDADVIDIDNTLVLNSNLTLNAPNELTLRDVLGGGYRLDLASPATLLRGTMTGLDRLRTNGVGLTTLDGASISARVVRLRDAVRLAAASSVHGDDAVRFDKTIDGAHDLAVTSDGQVRFGGDIGGETALASLSVQAGSPGNGASNAIVFEGSLVRTEGDISLNAAGKDAPAQVATIAAMGDLTLESMTGDVRVGQNEKLTALGDLTIRALDGSASFGDLNAGGDLTVDAAAIEIQLREAGQVLLPDGTLIADAGVDFNAGGGIHFSTAPTLTGAGADPIFNSGTGLFSDTLNGFERATRDLASTDLIDGEGRVLDVRSTISSGPQPDPTPPSLASTFGADLFPVTDRVDREAIAITALVRFSLFLRGLTAEELRTLPEGRAIYLGEIDTGYDRSGPVLTNAARLRRDAVMRMLDRYSRIFVATTVDPATGETIVINEDRSEEIRASLEAAIAAWRTADPGTDLQTFALEQEAHVDAAIYLEGLQSLLAELESIGATPSELRISIRSVLQPILPTGMSITEFERMIRG